MDGERGEGKTARSKGNKRERKQTPRGRRQEEQQEAEQGRTR